MKKLISILSLAIGLLSSCIRNNIPLPVLVPEITPTIEGCMEVTVDNDKQIITAVLEETTDICNVVVSGLDIITPTGMAETVCEPSMVGTWDLSQPKTFVISNFDNYNWQLLAKQDIERYLTVEGQVGSTHIDPKNRRILVYVSKKTRFSKLKLCSIKLGPRDITSYSLAPGDDLDLQDKLDIEINYHGRTEIWELFAERSLIDVSIRKASAWTRCAWVSANGVAGKESGFMYRLKGDEEWIQLPAENVTMEGSIFTGRIDDLQPETTYECLAFCGTDQTSPVEFTTEGEAQIPNGNFEVYARSESSKYFSYFDPAHALWNYKWWDSGNVGSTAVGESGVICAPDTDDKAEGNASVRLNSRYVVVKFAAGNLFSGEFDSLVGMEGGKVNFGRPWTLRPRKLKFCVKTQNGPIDHLDSKVTDVKLGDNDICEVFVALGDWDYKKYGGNANSPVQVNTTVSSTLFNPDGENVIAFGRFSTDQSSDWHEVEIDLDYRDCFRAPTHIIISCAASKYGDFFTGCSTNTMWLDDMRFEY